MGQLAACRDCPARVFKECVFSPHVQGASGERKVKFSVKTTLPSLCSPHSFNKGFGPSVCPAQNTQNTNKNESNKFVSEGKPLSAERTFLTAERGIPSEPPHVASSVPTRWRHCITNKSVGLKTQLRSAPSGDTREPRSGLANRFGSRVGDAYNNAGVQIAIRSKTPSFQRHSLFSHGRESLSHSGRGNFISLKQGSDSGGTPQSDEPGFLFPVFSGSKERRLSPPYLGPSSVEQTFEEIQFQNADTGRTRPCHKTERLVHISRSERCFLSHKHLSSAQEVSSFCLPGHMLRIHSSSVWTQFESPVFLSVRGGGLNASENNRSENPDLHRRLAHHSRIEGEGVAGHRPCARAHHIARVPSERGQEQSHAQSECHFPGFGVELGCHASASLSGARSLSNELSVTVQRRGESAISHMSQDAGSHGFIHPSCAIRTPEDEGVHEMGFVATFQPDSRPLPLGYSDARVLCSPASLEERRLLRTGNPSRGGYDAESGDDRCILNRLGCHPGGQNGERSVAKQTTFSTYKLFRAFLPIVKL